MSKDLGDICKRFNDMHWHDSKLIGFQVFPIEGGLKDDTSFDIKLVTNAQLGKQEWKNVKLILKDCRIIKLNLDLLGKQLCGGDLASAHCEKESALKEYVEGEELKHFDLPQEENPLAELLHFTIQLIHPGGEINVFARDFELVM